MLPALKPIMMRERVSLIFIEYGQIDVVADIEQVKNEKKSFTFR